MSIPPIGLLAVVLTSCPLLEELEIAHYSSNSSSDNVEFNISGEELSVIGQQCVNLKRLTLSHLKVQNGHFIQQAI